MSKMIKASIHHSKIPINFRMHVLLLTIATVQRSNFTVAWISAWYRYILHSANCRNANKLSNCFVTYQLVTFYSQTSQQHQSALTPCNYNAIYPIKYESHPQAYISSTAPKLKALHILWGSRTTIQKVAISKV